MKAILFIFCFSLALNLSAQFDINDPRNPNCPCHKYQKIADDEYRQLIARGKKETANQYESVAKNTDRDVPFSKAKVDGENKIEGRKKSENFLERFFKKTHRHRSKRKGIHTNPFYFLKRKKSADSCFTF